MDKEYLKGRIPLGTNLIVLEKESSEYKLLNGKATFYLCKNFSCLAPSNQLDEVLRV